MKSWPTVPLGDLLAQKSGSVDPSKSPDEVFDLYSIPAFDSGQPEVRAGNEIGSAKQVVHPNDVLLSRIVPHIRRAWVVGENRGRRLIASGEWIIFRSPNAHPPYLRFFLVGDPFHARFMQTVSGVGGSLLRAEASEVAKIQIPVPPLAEQERIVELLDQADELRKLRAQADRRTAALIPALFLEMFGDPIVNPLNWPMKAIGEITAVETGRTPSRAIPTNFDGEIPWVKTTEVNGSTITDTEEKLTEKGFRSVSGRLFPPGSILVAMYGQGKTRGQTGLLAIEAFCNQACAVILPSEHFVANFMIAYLRLSYQGLRELARGGSQENLNLGIVRSFRTPLPPLTMQEEFAKRVTEIRELEAMQAASRERLDALFQSMLHRAFRGEL